MVSIDHLLVRAATIIHPGATTDRYGNTIADWTDTEEEDVAAWFAQRRSSEVTGLRGDAFVSGFVLVVAADVTIGAGDRVELDDDVYEVDGPPMQAWRASPAGLHHIEVPLRRIEG